MGRPNRNHRTEGVGTASKAQSNVAFSPSNTVTCRTPPTEFKILGAHANSDTGISENLRPVKQNKCQIF